MVPIATTTTTVLSEAMMAVDTIGAAVTVVVDGTAITIAVPGTAIMTTTYPTVAIKTCTLTSTSLATLTAPPVPPPGTQIPVDPVATTTEVPTFGSTGPIPHTKHAPSTVPTATPITLIGDSTSPM